jgi:hypothetical protein
MAAIAVAAVVVDVAAAAQSSLEVIVGGRDQGDDMKMKRRPDEFL